MNDLIDRVKSAKVANDTAFFAFLHEVLELQIEYVIVLSGFCDEKFAQAIRGFIESPDLLLNLSVEHRNAIDTIYTDCEAAWAAVQLEKQSENEVLP